ncbi:MAG: diguanylate cyclase [Lachnospiraceae bacterium]|nr:diguanylate cyclase [Lachnospiraceae bacterium]
MKKYTERGVSLRGILILMIVIMTVMAGIVGFSTYRLTMTFNHLTAAVEEHMALEKAAHELMDASDYLTENVQRFTVNGDMRFLEQYFTEAFETNRREEALRKMDVDERTGNALNQLEQAMNNSLELMQREYYAMRLVIEAKGYTDYPEILDDVELNAEDEALSPDEKMRRATEVVLDSEYYEQKDLIRTDMKESLDEVDNLMYSAKGSELSALQKELKSVRMVVLIQTLCIFFMIIMTSLLGIHPVLNAVDRIREDSPIPEAGANEFRYLAQAYNKMYNRYRTSLERLNFKASHDELTGAYNRAGYDLLLSSIDLDSTYMMLIDVDNFKGINDNYGHETGDKVLVKLVNILYGIFRDDDYIFRIGGDEFVVFIVHSEKIRKGLIESKIDKINYELADTEDGLPPVSISIGIVQGKDAANGMELFEKTDAAMYESKKKGKHTYTFYSTEIEENGNG